MCFPKKDKSAAIAAQAEKETKEREAKRQADIKAGNVKIDDAFAQYNPGYYNQFKTTYAGNYNPEIDKQYESATGKMTAALAGRGMIDSSLAANKFGEALATKNEARARVANDAEVAAGDLKGKVAARKSDLYSLNQAAADPEGISAQAVGAATALTAPPAYSQLGQVFADVLAPFGQYMNARNNSPGSPYTYRPTSSGKVVN